MQNIVLSYELSKEDLIVYYTSILTALLYIGFSIDALVRNKDDNILIESKQFLTIFVVFNFLELIRTILNLMNNYSYQDKKANIGCLYSVCGLTSVVLRIWDCVLLFGEIGFKNGWTNATYRIITIIFFSNIFLFGFFILLCFFIVITSCCPSLIVFCVGQTNEPTIAVAFPIFGNINFPNNNYTNVVAQNIVSIESINNANVEVVFDSNIRTVECIDIETGIER